MLCLTIGCHCSPVPAPSVFQFISPGRLNLGLNAGVRLPQLPSLEFRQQEVPVPVPDVAMLEFPVFYPQINFVGRQAAAPITRKY